MQPDQNSKLGIAQVFTKGGIPAPFCEAESCANRAKGLYSNQDGYGVALCADHEDVYAGQIMTCSKRNPNPKFIDVCKLPKGHDGAHAYLIDGKVERTWKDTNAVNA